MKPIAYFGIRPDMMYTRIFTMQRTTIHISPYYRNCTVTVTMHAVDKTYVVWRREINYSILFYSTIVGFYLKVDTYVDLVSECIDC